MLFFFRAVVLWDDHFIVYLHPGHRTLYIGVHVPLGRRSHRRHHHHGHRHRKRSRERDSGVCDGRESLVYGNLSFSFLCSLSALSVTLPIISKLLVFLFYAFQNANQFSRCAQCSFIQLLHVYESLLVLCKDVSNLAVKQ